MGLNAKNVRYESTGSGKRQDPVAEGNYIARLVQVVDFGLQAQRPFKGEEKKPAYEVMLTYELCTEFMKDEDGNDMEDKPRWISETMPMYSLEADRAKSTKRIKAIDTSLQHEGNLAEMVGMPCTVTVVQNVNKHDTSKVYVDVGNVTPPMKGLPVPELKNDPVIFDLDEPDMETYERLPDWVQEKLRKNLEYEGSPLQKLLEGAVSKKEETPEEPESEEDSNDNPY